MGRIGEFYRRKKNPWLAFVLVVLLGPFGFLYHSWKTALAILLVVGPLWIAFLRNTRFDLIAVPWAHYSALVIMAGFASLQIKGRQDEEAHTAAALSMMAPSEVASLMEFLKANPKLYKRVKATIPPFSGRDGQISATELALLLSTYGLYRLERGDLSGAAGSYLYSMRVFPENPMAWAGMAETYAAWGDLIAGRWARKVLSFQPNEGDTEPLARVFADAAENGTLDEMKARMRAIVRACAQHPEWRDSYTLKRGLYREL